MHALWSRVEALLGIGHSQEDRKESVKGSETFSEGKITPEGSSTCRNHDKVLKEMGYWPRLCTGGFECRTTFV